MSWSNTMTQVQVGADVYGSDGHKVGTVARVQPTYLVVEKGFFFPTDYYIPLTAITQVQDGQVVLNVSKDMALHSGWETIPVTTNDAILTGDRGWDLASAVPATDRVLGQEATGRAVSEDELVIPLREEELTATVRATAAGAVRIQKRVVAEDRVLDVPVTEEHIRVERRVVNRPADATDGDAFEEIIIEVPLTAEQVELHTQARVAEEVVVHKDAVQHTEHLRGAVRHEEVEVIDEGLLTETRPERERAI